MENSLFGGLGGLLGQGLQQQQQAAFGGQSLTFTTGNATDCNTTTNWSAGSIDAAALAPTAYYAEAPEGDIQSDEQWLNKQLNRVIVLL